MQFELRAIEAIRSERRIRRPTRPTALARHLMVMLDRTFEALADPTRRSLIRRLARGPQTAGALAEPFDISRPAISRHLRVLREAGLVDVEPAGRRRMYRLSVDRLEGVQEWLAEVARHWDDALLAFKEHVEARR